MIDAASLLVVFVILFFVAVTLEEEALSVREPQDNLAFKLRRRPGRLERRMSGANVEN